MSNKPLSPVFRMSTKKDSIGSIKREVKANKPVVLSHDIPPGTKLTFVDISHSLATIDIDSKHNKFSALIETANEWLQKNYIWKVENCETVVLGFKQEKLDPIDIGATQRLLQQSTHNESEELTLLKSLRLWISRREDMPEMKKHIDLQTLACKTFLPQSCKFYENQIGWQQMDDVIETLNETIRCRRIAGQILNVESIYYEATEDWVVDTECPKQNDSNNKQETAIRVFYVVNAPPETPVLEIAIFDFLPDLSQANTTPPKFQPFSSLLYKIQDFLEENPEYTFLNCQSLNIKFKSLDELHTHFMVHINDIGFYLKFLRMVCTKPLHSKSKPMDPKLSINISPPNQIKSAGNSPKKDRDENIKDSDDSKDSNGQLDEVKPIRNMSINIESHLFEIQHIQHTLHGPFYPVKRAIEEFMERPEWQPLDDKRPERRWKYLCAETFIVLARDETDLEKRAELSLFTNKHSLLSLLVPRMYSVIRIFFDTSDVIPVRAPHKTLKKSQSESFEKHFKAYSFRHQSLPDSTFEYSDNTKESDLTLKNKIRQSLTCALM